MGSMAKRLQKLIFSFTTVIEVIMGIFIVLGILAALRTLLGDVAGMFSGVYETEMFDQLMNHVFTLVIAVEFIKMMCNYSPATVVEVLMFAIARSMIIDHSSTLNSLLGVLAIAGLFATRKFLFCEYDEVARTIFRGNAKVEWVNRILGVHIPYEDEQTIGQLVRLRMEERDIEVNVGVFLELPTLTLRVAKMENGRITRVEVIQSTTHHA